MDNNQKIFNSIDEQIEKLKGRGLSIPNEEKAKNYLLTNNYYNIINGYSKYFMVKGTEKYVDNASFDEISNVYLFDKQIKEAFFNAILDIEHHLKSVCAYYFAEGTKGRRYPYLDINCYDKNKTMQVIKSISIISNIIKNKKKFNQDDNSIYHYVKKYNDVPIWVVVDYFDFGLLESLIRSTNISIQNKIANSLIRFLKDNIPDFNDKFSPETMNTFIKNIREVRNICAHNNRLIGFECRSDSKYFKPLHDLYNISNSVGGNKKTVYATFITMQCFLSKTEFAILNNTIRKRIKNLDNKLESIDINDILKLLGFPTDWHHRRALSQI